TATPSATPTPTATPSPTPTVTPTPTATPDPTPTPSSTPSSTPTMRVSVSPTSVTEGSDVTFTVSASSTVSQPVTVSYLMHGTAINGTDYNLTGTAGQVTIPAGQSFATITLHSIADHVFEKSETAVMALSSGSGYKLPKRGTKASLTILNGP